MVTHHFLNVAVRDIGPMVDATVAPNAKELAMDLGIAYGTEMRLVPAFDGNVLGDDGRHVAFLTRKN